MTELSALLSSINNIFSTQNTVENAVLIYVSSFQQGIL